MKPRTLAIIGGLGVAGILLLSATAKAAEERKVADGILLLPCPSDLVRWKSEVLDRIADPVLKEQARKYFDSVIGYSLQPAEWWAAASLKDLGDVMDEWAELSMALNYLGIPFPESPTMSAIQANGAPKASDIMKVCDVVTLSSMHAVQTAIKYRLVGTRDAYNSLRLAIKDVVITHAGDSAEHKILSGMAEEMSKVLEKDTPFAFKTDDEAFQAIIAALRRRPNCTSA